MDGKAHCLFSSSLIRCPQWISLIAQLVKNPPAMQETPVQFLGREDPWRRDRLPTPVFFGFPCGSVGKESACNVGDLGPNSGLGWYPEEGKGYPLQYSGLENSMKYIVHGVAKSQTQISNFHFTTHLTLWLNSQCHVVEDVGATTVSI